MDKALEGAGVSLEDTNGKSVSGKACAKALRWTASGMFQEQGDPTGRKERMVMGTWLEMEQVSVQAGPWPL